MVPPPSRLRALDGVRGLAVLFVLAGHVFHETIAVAGQVGVAVFFTLSGYLITSLLLAERDRTGSVDLGAFYVRRARRLLPALVVFLAAMLALGYALSPHFGTPDTVWPALVYVANFFPSVSGTGHLWSLSIEEQFYLVFPLLLVTIGRRLSDVALLRLLVGTALASAAWRICLFARSGDEARSYFGTDTCACLLLAGCALAVWLRSRQGLPMGYAMPAVGVLVALVLSSQDGVVFGPLASLATLVVIAATQRTEPWWLAWGPLVLVGRRSYALYLWHMPMIWVVWPSLGKGWPALAFCLAVSWLLAVASWRLVERPFLPQHEGTRRGAGAPVLTHESWRVRRAA